MLCLIGKFRSFNPNENVSCCLSSTLDEAVCVPLGKAMHPTVATLAVGKY